MNPLKSEVKIGTTLEIGANVEDMCEGAEATVHEYKGAEDALKQSTKAVQSLHTHVDKDLEDGKIDEVLNEPLLVAEYVKRYVTRAIGILDNLATRAEYQKFKAQGKAEGLRAAVESIKKVHDAEEAKLRGYLAAVELEQAKESGEAVEEEGTGRPSAAREASGRPIDKLADRRAAAKEAKSTEKKPTKLKPKGR